MTTAAVDEVELLIWPGDWDLPTTDRACLTALAYSKFTGVRLNITETGNTWKSTTGNFPILKMGSRKIHCEERIKEAIDILSESQEQQIVGPSNGESTNMAYLALVRTKLMPAIKYMLWVDDKNMSELTRPWFSKTLPFPLGMWVTGGLQRSVEQSLESVYITTEQYSIHDTVIEQKVYKEAKECLNLLSHKLEDKDYFNGDGPSYIDAVIFACLSVLYKCPAPNNQLQQHIKQCTNLCQYCDRILHDYFPKTKQAHKTTDKSENTKSSSTKDVNSNIDPEFPNKTRNKILGALLAFTAMVSFAFFSGILQIERVGDTDLDTVLDDDHDDSEDERENE